MKTVTIENKTVGEGYPVVVVAEIGVNHNGDVYLAQKLIEAASAAGCDMVKLQTHIAEAEMLEDNTVPPHFPEPRWQFTKRMELTKEEHISLIECARQNGIIFFSSPFSIEAVELLNEIDVPAFKVASGEVTNLPLLELIAKKNKPVILSSGMSTMEELEQAVNLFKNFNSPLILMHCTSNYPCPFELLNLQAIPMLKKRFGMPVGFSDHSPVIYTSIAAVTLGAGIIERHFTLDKNLYGPDHKCSLTPGEMQQLVASIRNIEKAMGSGEKTLTPDANRFRTVFQKSVVSLVDIAKGSTIETTMLSTKKPGKGLAPARLKDIIGKKAKENIPANTLITEEQIEW